jgi:DNA-binding HxlR family transcriptional regulator
VAILPSFSHLPQPRPGDGPDGRASWHADDWEDLGRGALAATRRALRVVTTRWMADILYVLASGTKRNTELMAEIRGISQKMLTQTLRAMERDGLVQRRVYPEVPPRVEYSLTSTGRALIQPLLALGYWADRHLDGALEPRA